MRITHAVGLIVVSVFLGSTSVLGVGFYDIGAGSSTGMSSTGGVVAANLGGASIWTEAGGAVNIGANYTAAGAAFFGSQVLVGGNSGGNAYYWLGDTAGVGTCTQMPLSNGTKAWTALCTGGSATDFWIAGNKGTTTGQRKATRYKFSSNSTTTIGLPPSGNSDSYFYGASNVGTFAGRYQYGAVSPSGSRQAMASTGIAL